MVEIALLIVVDPIELIRATLLSARVPAFFHQYHSPFAVTGIHDKGVGFWVDALDKAVLGPQ